MTPLSEDPQPTPQDGAPIPALDPEAMPRRIPNFGHALLFVSFSFLLLAMSELVLAALGLAPSVAGSGAITIAHPKLQIAAQAMAYVCTLLAALLFFPIVWRRSFAGGLSWNLPAARTQAWKLVPLGFLLGGLVQGVTYFITGPKTVPIDEFFSAASDAWIITLFGTTLAPLFEEICFRGFLLPAFAIAYDWLSLPRTPEAYRRWETTTTLTPLSLVFSAIVSSLLFALLHAQQVAHATPILGVLFTVSLVLTFVRVRTQSVAASTLVHASYNLFVFLTVIVATGGYRHLDRITK